MDVPPDASPLSRSQTAFMVAALVASVISFQLNATMLGPAIRDINTELGPEAFASMSNYFYLSGAIANVVFIRWSDYVGRKRVLLGIMIVLCASGRCCGRPARARSRIRLGRTDCRTGHGGGVSFGVVDRCRNRHRRPRYEPGSQAEAGGHGSGRLPGRRTELVSAS